MNLPGEVPVPPPEMHRPRRRGLSALEILAFFAFELGLVLAVMYGLASATLAFSPVMDDSGRSSSVLLLSAARRTPSRCTIRRWSL